MPMSGLTALRALRDVAGVRPGQTVLITGAGGGIGTFAVQIAKAMGAEVTGVCSTGKLDLVRSLGADHVIDYTREDFTERTERYDVVLDNVLRHTLTQLVRVVEPGRHADPERRPVLEALVRRRGRHPRQGTAAVAGRAAAHPQRHDQAEARGAARADASCWSPAGSSR